MIPPCSQVQLYTNNRCKTHIVFKKSILRLKIKLCLWGIQWFKKIQLCLFLPVFFFPFLNKRFQFSHFYCLSSWTLFEWHRKKTWFFNCLAVLLEVWDAGGLGAIEALHPLTTLSWGLPKAPTAHDAVPVPWCPLSVPQRSWSPAPHSPAVSSHEFHPQPWRGSQWSPGVPLAALLMMGSGTGSGWPLCPCSQLPESPQPSKSLNMRHCHWCSHTGLVSF